MSTVVVEYGKAGSLAKALAQAVPESISASVDWLTLTAMSRAERSELHVATMKYHDRCIREGQPVKLWKFKGYTGWATDHYRAGSRQDSDILMLSGQAANLMWLKYTDCTRHATRIDLAVTFHLERPETRLVDELWQDIVAYKSIKPWRLEFAKIENTKGGQTLYVGARTSREFGRVYDKGIQEGGEEGFPAGYVWRYEVEAHNRLAQGLVRSLRKVEAESVATQIAGFVYDWFNKRHVTPLWPRGEQLLNVAVETVITSDAKKIKWLTEQVRPSIRSLVARGKLGEVVTALGLDGCATWQEWALDQVDPIGGEPR